MNVCQFGVYSQFKDLTFLNLQLADKFEIANYNKRVLLSSRREQDFTTQKTL